jgi:hypothetical protein
MISPEGFYMKYTAMLYATYKLHIEICYRNKRHLPLTDRCYCPYKVDIKAPQVIFLSLAVRLQTFPLETEKEVKGIFLEVLELPTILESVFSLDL